MLKRKVDQVEKKEKKNFRLLNLKNDTYILCSVKDALYLCIIDALHFAGYAKCYSSSYSVIMFSALVTDHIAIKFLLLLLYQQINTLTQTKFITKA